MEWLKLFGDNVKVHSRPDCDNSPGLEEDPQLIQPGTSMIDRLSEDSNIIDRLKTHLLIILNIVNKHALIFGKPIPIEITHRLVNVIQEIEEFIQLPAQNNNGKTRHHNGTKITSV